MPSLKALAKEAKGKKAPKPRKAVEEKAAPPKKVLSSERVEESDDEDEESNEEESSDNESIPENPADAKLPAPDGSSSSSENDSESSEGGSGEESGESSEEDQPETPVEKASASSKSARGSVKEPASKDSAPKKPAAYKPPPGFDPAIIKDATQAGSTFKKSKLEGKQIWYFTAPASVPISAIKSMSLLGMKSGEVVYSHKGSYYGFVQDISKDSTNARIMVPSSYAEYQSIPKPIDKAFRLQQVVNIPGVNGSGSSSNSHATVPQKKPVRPQPKGLKMRYAPIGFSDGKTGTIGSESSSDEEMEDTPAQFQRLVSISSDESENSSDSDEEMADTPPLQSKKNSSQTAKETVNGSSSNSLKRKHGDVSEKATKHSSSNSAIIDGGKKLKRQKTAETESQKSMVDRLSGSTKPLVLITPISPPKPLISKSESNIKLLKHYESSTKTKSEDKSTKKSKKDKSSKEPSQETDAAVDEERRKKAKKSRKEGSGHSWKEKGK